MFNGLIKAFTDAVTGLFGGGVQPPQPAPAPPPPPQQPQPSQQPSVAQSQQPQPFNINQLAQGIAPEGFYPSIDDQLKQSQNAQAIGNQFGYGNVNPIPGATASKQPVSNPILPAAQAIGQAVDQYTHQPTQPLLVKGKDGKGALNPDQKVQQQYAENAANSVAGAETGLEKAGATLAQSGLQKAAEELSTFYKTPLGEQQDITDLIGKTNGATQLGNRLAKNLGTAVKTMIPSAADRQNVFHALDGAVDPTTLSPEQQQVVGILHGLNQQGLDIRKAINPTVGTVENYATRLLRSGTGGSTSGRVIQSLRDVFDTSSPFSTSRVVGKFIGPDGKAVFGQPQDLGITRQEDGSFLDKDGNMFRPTKTNVQELEANSPYKYEKDAGQVSRTYHADTTKLKARQDAVTELTQNPDRYGLTGPDVTAPAGYREIQGVNELGGWHARPEVAKAIEDGFKPTRPEKNPLLRGWQGLNSMATQLIVMNPTIHGLNLAVQAAIQSGNMPLLKGSKIQAGPLGIAKLGAHWMAGLVNSGYRERIMQQYFKDGGHVATYGKDQRTAVSAALDSLNLPGVNKANAAAMSSIEGLIRASLHDANKAAGMPTRQSIKQIDTFLGRKENAGPIARNVGMFYHWLKAQGTAIGNQVAHPIENAGANVNTLLLAAAGWGINKAYQDWTGNKNAYLSPRGEFGLVKKGVDAAEGAVGLAQGGDSSKLTGVITGSLNPGINAGLDQLAGKNLFTGQTLTTPGQRAGDLLDTLVSPAQGISRVSSGKRSGPEVLANLQGAYMPHAKGAPAAPNLPAFNTSGAQAQPGGGGGGGGDATGYSQQQTYFKAVDQATKQYLQDPGDQAQWKALHPGGGGQAIDTVAHYSVYQSNPNVFAADKAIALAQKGPHDPIFDLNAQQANAVFNVEKITKSLPGSSSQLGKVDQNYLKGVEQSSWYQSFSQARGQFYQQLAAQGMVSKQKADAYTPPTPQQSQLLGQMNGLSGSKLSQFINSTPALQQYLSQHADEANIQRADLGLPPLPKFPEPPNTKVAGEAAAYSALPQGTGARSAYLKSHPDYYAYYQQEQNYYAQVGSSAPASKSGNSGSSSGGTLPSLTAPTVKPTHFNGRAGHAKTVKFKFRAPEPSHVKPIRPSQAPAPRKPRSAGVKSTSDTIKST